MSALKRSIARVFLVLGGSLIGLLLVEGVVRTLPPNAAAQVLFNAHQNAPSGLYMVDHKVAFRPTPGFQGTMKSPGYQVDLRVNSLGLRGGEIQRDERPVWLALGDSFTFAAQVPESQTFVSLLGEEMGVQLLNAGSDGHGTQHELARYRQLEKQVPAELVLVVFFTGNDFHNNLHWRKALDGAKKRPNHLPVQSASKGPLRGFLNQNSFLWGMLQMRKRAKGLSAEGDQEHAGMRRDMSIFHSSGAELLETGVNATRAPMQMLRDRVARRDAQLVVAVASPVHAIELERTQATFDLVRLSMEGKDLSAPERGILGLLEELEIPACPLDPALREAHARGERSFLALDGHWSASGHRVVAESLAGCLEEQGLGSQDLVQREPLH